MASLCYSLHSASRIWSILLATIHSHQWENIKLRDIEKRTVLNIKNDIFWKAIYFLLRSIFSALRGLRFSDSNTPGMDKIHDLTCKNTKALQKSAIDIGNDDYVPSFSTITIEDK